MTEREKHYRTEVFFSEEDAGYIARLLEVPTLSAFGERAEDAVRELQIATENWLVALAARGEEPPEPFMDRNYSGEFRLRVPKELHRALVMEAERNAVSLNAYCAQKLAVAPSSFRRPTRPDTTPHRRALVGTPRKTAKKK